MARKYRFSAAHTLRAPHLSEAENRGLYGKCAHPSGHGHDYMIEIAVSGNSLTDDVVIGRGWLDRLVRERLDPRFDRADLSETLGDGIITSGENLAVEVYRLLIDEMPAGIRLAVRIEETRKNSFRYTGDVEG